jgi:hypothetical protein
MQNPSAVGERSLREGLTSNCYEYIQYSTPAKIRQGGKGLPETCLWIKLGKLSRMSDLNRRPTVYKTAALPLS